MNDGIGIGKKNRSVGRHVEYAFMALEYDTALAISSNDPLRSRPHI